MRLLPYTTIAFKTALSERDVRMRLLDMLSQETREETHGFDGYSLKSYEKMVGSNKIEFKAQYLNYSYPNNYQVDITNSEGGLIISCAIDGTENNETMITTKITVIPEYIVLCSFITLVFIIMLGASIQNIGMDNSIFYTPVLFLALIMGMRSSYMYHRNKYIKQLAVVFETTNYYFVTKKGNVAVTV